MNSDSGANEAGGEFSDTDALDSMSDYGGNQGGGENDMPVSYTHLRAHET